MVSVSIMLAVGIVSSAVGTAIGTVAGLYVYNRWFK